MENEIHADKPTSIKIMDYFQLYSPQEKLSSKAEFGTVASNAKIILTAYGGNLSKRENDVDTVRGYVNELRIKFHAEVLLKRTIVATDDKDLVTYAYLQMDGDSNDVEGVETGSAEIGQHEYFDFDTLIRLSKIPSTVIEVTNRNGDQRQWKIKNAPIFKPLSERILKWATLKVKQESEIKVLEGTSMQAKERIPETRSMPIRDDLGRVVTPLDLLGYGRDGHRVRCHKVGGSNPTSVLCAHLSCPLGS